MERLLYAAAIAALLAVAAASFELVTIGGAIAGAAVAFVICASLGLPGLLILLAFFPVTSGLSYVNARTIARRKPSGSANLAPTDGLKRGAPQVLANGGIAALLAAYHALTSPNGMVLIEGRERLVEDAGCIFFTAAIGPHSALFPAIAASLASAAADTASHEMGAALRGRTVLLPQFRRVQPGATGGVSLEGTLVAILVIAGFVFLAQYLGLALGWREVAAVAAGAACGNLADTLVGSLVEGRARWWGNSLTNLVGTAVAAVTALLIAL
jgi:uncharacterized membrane protein